MKKLIQKCRIGSPGLMPITPEQTKRFAEWLLKGVGKVTEVVNDVAASALSTPTGTATTAATTPVTNSGSNARVSREAKKLTKEFIELNGVVLSPSSWVVGKGNPWKGALTISTWDPRWLLGTFAVDALTLAKGKPALKATGNAAVDVAARAGSKTAKAKAVSRRLGENIEKAKLLTISSPKLEATLYAGTKPLSDNALINKNNMHRATPELWDKQYMDAINSGNIPRVLNLRDLHFINNAPNTKIVNQYGYPIHMYHGTNNLWNSFDINLAESNTGLNIYGKGLYTTPDLKFASMWGDNIIDLYINSERPYIGGYGVDPRRISVMGWFNKDRSGVTFPNTGIYETVDFPKLLKELDQADGAYYRSLEGIVDELVVPKGSLAKLSDAITYDDNGNIIPLSQRDNFNVNDIRYFGQVQSTPTIQNRTAPVASPLITRITRLQNKRKKGIIPSTLLALIIRDGQPAAQIEDMITKLYMELGIDENTARSAARTTVMNNGKGVHTPVIGDDGNLIGGISYVDRALALKALRESGIANPMESDLLTIMGHEWGHLVEVPGMDKEVYTLLGQVLDNEGVIAANPNWTVWDWINKIEKYLSEGRLDNGISNILERLYNMDYKTAQKFVANANRFSVGTGAAYLLNNKE